MKKTIITICIVISSVTLFATEPNSKGKQEEKNISYISSSTQAPYVLNIYQEQGFYIEASPGLSAIINNNLSSDIWKSESQLGYNFNIGYFRSFSSWFKIKFGLGFLSYSTNLTGNGEIQSPELKDIDNDTYIETLILSDATYSINPMYLSVPLTIEFGNPSVNKVGYYVNFGIEYSYLISENNTTQGTYSASGTYPEWGVTLSDVPELGFYSNKNLESGWSIQKGNYSLKSGAGITIPLSGVVIFRLGVAGYIGLKDIGKRQTTETDFSMLSEEAYAFRSKYINNPLAASGGTKTLFTGIEFGFYISKRVK